MLKKLMAALCPPVTIFLCCLLFRWLDQLIAPSEFLSFVLKGLLLGVSLALLLPLLGVAPRNTGLIGWVLAAAAILLGALVYQYLENSGAVHSELLRKLMSINGQVVFAQSAAEGFLLTLAILQGRKKKPKPRVNA